MKFYLNNKEISVLNGATFSIKKDETLDSGKIELVFSEDKAPIKPMSEIRIEDDDDTYNFVVLSDTVEIVSKNPSAYKHTLEFAQNTKKLSKIQVRNTQFSQPAKNSLKCGCNATFQNIGASGSFYMSNLPKDGEVEYSYQMEVSQKHKVKGSHFKINTKWIKFDSMSDGIYYETLQSECPKLYIYYQLYKDGVYLYEKGAQYSDGDIDYIVTSLANGVYEIKNLKVMLLSDTTKYSTYDLFVVNISLICDVYYYSLYDVLDILRKQIALEETVGIINVDKPTIGFTQGENDYTYDITIKQEGSHLGVLYYKYKFLEDEWTEWFTTFNETTTFTLANSTSEEKTAYIEAYVKVSNVESLTANASQVFAPGVVINPPSIVHTSYGNWSDQVSVITNATQSDAITYYRYYKNSSLVQDWTIYQGSFVVSADTEKMTYYRVQAKTSSVEAGLVSEWTTLNFSIDGTSKYDLTAPDISYRTEYNASSSGYNIYITFTNNNKVACNCYYTATGSIIKTETIVEGLSANGGSKEILLGVSISSSDKGIITACLKYGANTSPTNSMLWTYSSGITYTLTKVYTGVGLSKTYTEEIDKGTLVNPSDYIEEFSGYKYSSCNPSNSFYMNSATTITYSYLVGGKLDNPIITQYSTNVEEVTMQVYNPNNDTVTFYYVINPDEIPTSEKEIYDAVDHYTISSISAKGSATEELIWASDTELKIYGAFVSTSHGTTYDESDVATHTFNKLIAPGLTISNITTSGYTATVYNPNSVSAMVYIDAVYLYTVGAKSSYSKTDYWRYPQETVSATLYPISGSEYAKSDTTKKTISKPKMKLSAPTLVININTYESVQFKITNTNDLAVDIVDTSGSTITSLSSYGSDLVTYTYYASTKTLSVRAHTYDSDYEDSSLSSLTATRPSQSALTAPSVSFARGIGTLTKKKYIITITNNNSIAVNYSITGTDLSQSGTISANGKITTSVDYLSISVRSYIIVFRATGCSDVSTTITIPAN